MRQSYPWHSGRILHLSHTTIYKMLYRDRILKEEENYRIVQIKINVYYMCKHLRNSATVNNNGSQTSNSTLPSLVYLTHPLTITTFSWLIVTSPDSTLLFGAHNDLRDKVLSVPLLSCLNFSKERFVSGVEASFFPTDILRKRSILSSPRRK